MSDEGCKISIKNDPKYSILVSTEEGAQSLKELYRVMLVKKLDDMASKDIPRNMLQEQQFEMKFETYTEQVLQYHEELCRMVAMSVVPPEIHKINN